MKKKHKLYMILLLLFAVLLLGCSEPIRENVYEPVYEAAEEEFPWQNLEEAEKEEVEEKADEAELQGISVTKETYTVADIPDYSGDAYVALNNNIPQFLETEITTTSYEYYSELDSLGRCGVVSACIGTDLMPTEERGSIGQVKPTGWKTTKYDIVDGKYLYNRCHLIGFQLTGENANESNLITGTRYLNIEGMLPFENMVADYIKETGNHVMYRVTPLFDGDNLVASGVQIEAQSVEDNGEGILFNVYCYNVQPGITIDYATGESCLALQSDSATLTDEENDTATTYVFITKSGTKYHSDSSCSNIKNASQVTKEEAIDKGYSACKKCN